MSTPLDLQIDPEKVHEIPMVDLAFMILKKANTPYYYRDLMNEVAKLRGLSEEEINEVIAQLYTEINIDGRFACVGTNLWGLKRWYPIEKSDDPVGGAKRPRIINDDTDDDDEDFHEEEVEEEEDNYDLNDDDNDADEDDGAYSDDDSDVDDLDDEEEVLVDEDDLDDEEEEEEEEEEDLADEEDGDR